MRLGRYFRNSQPEEHPLIYMIIYQVVNQNWTLLNNYDLEDVRGAGLQIEELIVVDNLCAMFDSNVCKVWKESILDF